MTTAALVKALDAAGFEVYRDGILDALWLASLGSALSVGALGKGTVLPPPRLKPPGRDGEAVHERDEGSREGDAVSNDESDESPREGETEGDADLPDGAPARVYGHGEISAGDKTLPAAGVLLPSARTLPDRLALVRALRPFRQLVPSFRDFELDEERTAELTAEINAGIDGAVFPVLRPRYERRYEAHLVIEDDLARDLWAAPARELAQLLRESGAFRLVRSWRLLLDEAAPGNLARARLETPAGALFSTATLGHFGQLVFFLSPGRSLGWVDGTFARLIQSWRGASVALVHLRSRDRWPETMLGEPQAMAHTLQPGSANSALEVEPIWWRSGPNPAQPHVVKLPAIPLEAEAFGHWARMQMSLGRQTEAFLLDAAVGLTPEEKEMLAPETVDVRRALIDLRETSKWAYDLAILLAKAPFTLPVARLVQEVAQRGSTSFAVLADLMLSDVVELKAGQPSAMRENTYFVIREAARPMLLRGLRSADAAMLAMSLEDRISHHLSKISGRAESFSALIANPGGIERLPEWAQPFAYFLVSFRQRPPGPAHKRSWQQDLEALSDTLVGRLARLADADVMLERSRVNRALWAYVDNPRFIGQSSDAALRFLPEVAAHLRGRLAENPYLGLQILWVDDNPDNNSGIAARLREEGAVPIKLALTTEEALADPEIGTYDIILSDMSRGGENRAGYMLLEGLRKVGIQAPVIFFAGYTMSDPERRVQAITAGAFGATNRVDELLLIIEQAARGLVFRQERISDPTPVLRDLSEVPTGEFCTIEEIYREVRQSSRVADAEIVGSLLFYSPQRQHSWAVATRQQLVLLLDDENTRGNSNLVQRAIHLGKALPVSTQVNAQGSTTVGFGLTGQRWYYSKTLFKTPQALQTAVYALMEQARPGITADLAIEHSLSPEGECAQRALHEIGVDKFDDQALDIVIEASKFAPAPGFSDAVSLSRLFCGAALVGDRLIDGTGHTMLRAFAEALQSPSWEPARRQLFSLFKREDEYGAKRLSTQGFSDNLGKMLRYAAEIRGPEGALESDAIIEAMLTPQPAYRSSQLYRAVPNIAQLKETVTALAALKTSDAITGGLVAKVPSGRVRPLSSEIRKSLGYHLVYMPGLSIAPGDIGLLGNDGFQKIDHLSKVIKEFNAETVRSRVGDVHFKWDCDTRTEPSTGRFSVTFSRRNGVLIDLAGCHAVSIRDVPALAALLITRFEAGDWQKGWHVVTQVIEADRATILVSGAENASAELAFGPERTPTGTSEIADAAMLVSVHALDLSIIGKGMTPLIRLGKVRRPFLRTPRFEIVE